jgi:ATP/maltotriose-dependent transcriptional regulator MalT
MERSPGDNKPFKKGAAYVAPHRVRLWLQQADQGPDHLADAERWAREQDMMLDARQYNVAQIVLARLAIAQHRLRATTTQLDMPALSQFLEQQLRQAQAKGWIGRQIEILILQALAWQVQGDLEQALAALQQALAQAEPEGYLRVFLDEGPALAQLLHLAPQRGAWCEPRLAAYAVKLLDALSNSDESPGSQAASFHLVEPLSERELHVLRLLVVGHSNEEIAAELVVAVGTVKTHIHNIYGKLGVQRRAQAIARARELKLL